MNSFYIDDTNFSAYLIRHHFFGEEDIKLLGFYTFTFYDYIVCKLHTFREFSNYDYNIVSLGFDCFAHTIPIQWGLKRTLAQGETRKPFDISIHPPDIVYELLNNDFKDYYACTILKLEKHNIYLGKKGICFNHDYADSNKSDDENLEYFNKCVLPLRVENFRNIRYCNNIFIMHLDDSKYCKTINQNVIEKISDILRSDYNGKLLVITNLNFPDSKQYKIIKYNLPSENYIWHDSYKWLSVKGRNFEMEIINKIKEFIKNNSHYKPRQLAIPLPS